MARVKSDINSPRAGLSLFKLLHWLIHRFRNSRGSGYVHFARRTTWAVLHPTKLSPYARMNRVGHRRRRHQTEHAPGIKAFVVVFAPRFHHSVAFVEPNPRFTKAVVRIEV